MVTDAPEETRVETQDDGWETYWGEQVTWYHQGFLCLSVCVLFLFMYYKGI